MKITRRQLRKIIKEVHTAEFGEQSETLKLIRLFLSEYGTMQAIELAEMLPNINPNVLNLFRTIKSRVNEIIEYGRGNFPKKWKKHPLVSAHELSDEDYLHPLMMDLRELRYIADSISSGNEKIWHETGKVAMIISDNFQLALLAVNQVLREKYTPTDMMTSSFEGKSFVELAERFGIIL